MSSHSSMKKWWMMILAEAHQGLFLAASQRHSIYVAGWLASQYVLWCFSNSWPVDAAICPLAITQANRLKAISAT